MLLTFVKWTFIGAWGVIALSCTNGVLFEDDYTISISNEHSLLLEDRITYGFTLKNEGVTKATKIEIVIRYQFASHDNEDVLATQDEVYTHKETLLVNEEVEITNTFHQTDINIDQQITLSEVMQIRITHIRFFNSQQSANPLWETSYTDQEGEIFIRTNR